MAENATDHRSTDIFLWFSLGFCALISQVVFQRECINVFSGNELSIGLVLFVWLLFGGIGSLVAGKYIGRITEARKDGLLFWALLTLMSLFPLTLIALRLAKPALGVEPGEIVGLGPILAATIVGLAPLSLAQGALFAIYCHPAPSERQAGRPMRTSTVYTIEGLGAVVGGIVCHFILVGRVLPFASMLILSSIALAGAYQLRNNSRRSHLSVVILWAMIAALVVIALFSSSIEIRSAQLSFGGAKVVDVRESKYGRLVLAERFEQKSLFQNGLLLYSFPDRLAAEEAVHIPMLAHKKPESVLLLGGGCGGVLTEVLKHKPKTVDYVELDDKIIAISDAFLPPEERQAMRAPAVRVHYGDARRFVAQDKRQYDVVLLNLPSPTTALLNRFFTVEFFRAVHRRLLPGGLFALQVASSESYISDETRQFLCSIHKSLKIVFNKVILTPGDTAHFLASEDDSFAIDPNTLVSRLAQRQIETDHIADWSIPSRFETLRIRMVEEMLSECSRSSSRINRDLSPVCYYYALVLWGRESSGSVATAYEALGRITLAQVFALLGAVLIITLLFQRSSNRPTQIAALISLASVGFLEIAVEMIMLISYQVFFGNVYSMLGLLVCSYMAGIAVGAYWARRRVVLKKDENPLKSLLVFQAAAAAFPILVIALLSAMQSLEPGAWAKIVFIALIAASGAVGGALFVHANAAYSSVTRLGESRVPGTTYFADLLGSAVGAIAITSFLLPVFGVVQSLIIASCVALIGALCLVSALLCERV